VPASLRVANIIVMASIMLAACCFAQTCSGPSDTGQQDRLTFRNGDILTGRVLAIGAESVTFCNLALGELTIPLSLIIHVLATNRTIVLIPSDDSHLAATLPHYAAGNSSDQTFVLDGLQLQRLLAVPPLQDLPSAPKQQATTAAAQKPGARVAAPSLRWFFNINAPLSVAFGTTSQETYGGQLDLEFYEGKLYHSKMWAGGSYNRSWKTGSPSIFTDIFDGYFQQSRSLGTNNGGLYGKAEWFLNSALGMALQESFGAGYYSRDKTTGPFQFKWLADLRYFNERLYNNTTELTLVGSRFEGQLTYRKKDAADPTKTKYSLIVRSWVNPMWNNEDALQAFTTFQISVPFGRSFCINFSPIEDDYMRNAPVGKKKNYLASSLSLQVKRSYDPRQGCY